MDKGEFVREAPTYYALAIASVLSRSGEQISKREITKKFGYQFDEDNSDTYVNLLSSETLWERGIEWLRQRSMVAVKTLPFGPPVYSRGEKFSEQWYDLTSRGNDNVFRTYGNIGDAEDWLTDSLIDIYQQAEKLEISQQDFIRFGSIPRKLLDTWNAPEHTPASDPPPFPEHLTDEDAAQAIQDWFFTNFEDPVQNTHTTAERADIFSFMEVRTMRERSSKLFLATLCRTM